MEHATGDVCCAQRARRQPSRNLAQALQAARLRASDLMGQQVNGKGHNGVISRTITHQFSCVQQKTVSHTRIRNCCSPDPNQAAPKNRTTASKPQDQAWFNWSSRDPVDARIASKDGASPKIIVSVFCRSHPHAQPSLHVTRARRSKTPCSSLMNLGRIKQRPPQNFLHPNWHSSETAFQIVQQCRASCVVGQQATHCALNSRLFFVARHDVMKPVQGLHQIHARAPRPIQPTRCRLFEDDLLLV